MGRPLSKQISPTTTENTILLGTGYSTLYIKNTGPGDCYIEFDKAVDTASSYVLESGETIILDQNVIRLHYRTVNRTAKIYILKIT